jgi:two-component sensor histidine kinase
MECWAVAMLLFVLALAARLALAGHASGLPFLTFFPVTILTTILCGWRQALLVLILACGSADLLLPPPSWYGGDGPMHATLSLLLFSSVATLEIAIVAALVDAVRANYRLAAHEKTLFLELQHRVANTLQFVASMLTLTRQGIATPEQANAVLEQAATRILAIGQLHRRMYDAANDQQGLAPLLRDILQELFQDLPVTVHVDVARARVALSQMTPIVLLVTEAATNSAKHVFRQGRGSRFDVSMNDVEPGRLILLIRDDGPGIAQAEAPAASSLGLRIMRGLATQLGGCLVIENLEGTVVSVTFAKE